MRRGIILIVLLLLTSCLVKKSIETRIVFDQTAAQKAYEECMWYSMREAKLDSATTTYYKNGCKKDAIRLNTKQKKFLVYKKFGKIIKEIELTNDQN